MTSQHPITPNRLKHLPTFDDGPKQNIFTVIYNWLFHAIDYEVKDNEKSGSILSYHNEYAITIGWLIPRKGSVLTFTESVVVLGVSVFICFMLAYGSCRYQNNASPCAALPNADVSYLTLMELCSFVIAFFADSVLKRWWNLRTHIDELMVAGEQVVIIFAGILSSDVKDAITTEKKMELRNEKQRLMNKLIGLLVLTFRLLFNLARGNNDYSDMITKGHITEEEYQYFIQINAKPLHVCAIILNYIQESARKGLIGQEHGVSEANMQLLQNCVLNVRSNAEKVSMYIDVQIPYPFIQIISAVTYMFVIQLTLVCSAFIAEGISTASIEDITIGVLTICLYNFVLFGLLRLFEVLSNPLGDDAADFPGDTYMKTFEEDLKSVATNAFVLIDSEGTSLVSKMYATRLESNL